MPMQQVYENLTAVRETWLCLMEKCAKDRSARSLPSLESELGPGRYKLKSDKLLCLRDPLVRYRLHWRTDAGKHLVLGTFDAPRVERKVPQKKRKSDKHGTLVMGRDALGRKVIRCGAGPNSDMYLPIAVEYELVRGEWMPKPTHDEIAQAFRI